MELRPPCELVVRSLLPRLRAHLVKILVEEKGWSLAQAAKALGISVTAAAKYRKLLEKEWELDAELRRTAERIAGDVGSPQELIEAACLLCYSLRVSGTLCRLHAEVVRGLDGCRLCAKVPKLVAERREKVLLNLEEALKRADALAQMIPEVRTNIAMASESASSIMDVAAYPGRLTAIRGRLVAFSPPEFGASKHLASILLEAMRLNPKVRGITCIKFTGRVLEAARLLGMNYVVAERGEEEGIGPIITALKKAGHVPDILVDPGAPGVEPVAYIFGESAVDAVEKATKIVRAIRGMDTTPPTKRRV